MKKLFIIRIILCVFIISFGIFLASLLPACYNIMVFLILGFFAIGCIYGGLYNLYALIKDQAITKQTIKNGIRLTGKIIEYRDGFGIGVGDTPPLDVVVQYTINGEERTTVISTGDQEEKNYPLGAYCEIAILDPYIAIIPGSVRY